MNEEIELKLRVTPAWAARLKRSKILQSCASGRASTRRLLSNYFDTPGFDLKALGGGLRIRRTGRRFVQTLKLPVEDSTGLQMFHEFERDVVGEAPDLSHIVDSLRLARLGDHKFVTELVPVFSTEFRRTTIPVRIEDTDMEIAVDIGEIRVGDGRLPICEVELELRSGRPQRLLELALALHRELPAAWEYDTKAARGYRLAAGEAPRPRRGRSIDLEHDTTARVAFAVAARAAMAQMRANEACARLGEDAEGVHQFRVGLRRLRALVGAYRKTMVPEFHDYLAAELDWLQTEFGAARDWDVFIAESLQRLQTRLPEDQAVAAMLDAAKVLREDAYRTMRAAIDGPRYTELLLRLEQSLGDGSWGAPVEGEGAPLDGPAIDFARAILDRRYKRLRKLGGKRAELPDEGLHRLRIAGKKLRYVADFFRGLFPKKPAAKFIAALAEVQDRLGSLNDAAVSRQLLQALEARLADDKNLAAMRHASGLVQGWQAARVDRDLADFQDTWRRLRDRSIFWTGSAR